MDVTTASATRRRTYLMLLLDHLAGLRVPSHRHVPMPQIARVTAQHSIMMPPMAATRASASYQPGAVGPIVPSRHPAMTRYCATTVARLLTLILQMAATCACAREALTLANLLGTTVVVTARYRRRALHLTTVRVTAQLSILMPQMAATRASVIQQLGTPGATVRSRLRAATGMCATATAGHLILTQRTAVTRACVTKLQTQQGRF